MVPIRQGPPCARVDSLRTAATRIHDHSLRDPRCPLAVHNHYDAPPSTNSWDNLRTLFNSSCHRQELTLVSPIILLELRQHSTQQQLRPPAERTAKPLPTRHHGEPNGIEFLPERKAKYTPLGQVTFAISGTKWAEEAAEAESSRLHVGGSAGP